MSIKCAVVFTLVSVARELKCLYYQWDNIRFKIPKGVSMDCCREERLLQYLEGSLSPKAQMEIESHLEGCQSCRKLLCTWVRNIHSQSAHSFSLEQRSSFPDAGSFTTPTPSIARGSSLGRYLVLDCLGMGGMGVVYKAYDAELDRKVAIKLLRGKPTLPEDTTQQLLREARLMAKVNHPNAVVVYEIGTQNGYGFVAMEFVEGQSLREWLKQKRPSSKQILKLFIEAGQGLWAAHRAGMVHRDFKPGNVLVTKDERAKVADFGLAILSQHPTPSVDPDLDVGKDTTKEVDLTRNSLAKMAGSPDYMAPELFEGQPANEKSDQYSFCVALYEALYGQHPSTQGALGVTLPSRIHRAILRGLSRDPTDRFNNLDELLTKLKIHPRQTVRWVLAVLLLSLCAATGWLVKEYYSHRAALCQVAPEKWAGIWDDGQKEALKNAFLQTKQPSAQANLTETVKQIDAYVQEFNDTFRQNCEATHLRGEQSEHILDLRQQCLERRRGELRSLISLLRDSTDGELVNKAVETVQRLTPLDGCSDVSALTSLTPPPEDVRIRQRVQEAQKRLDEVAALFNAKKLALGLGRAQASVEEASAIGYPPLQAEAMLLLAQLQDRTGKDLRLADQSYQTAAMLAAVSGDKQRLALAFIERVYVAGYLHPNSDAASQWAQTAQALIQQLEKKELLEARLHSNLGSAFKAQYNYPKALEQHQLAYELRKRLLGERHLDTLRSLGNLANMQMSLGNYEEAGRHHLELVTAFKEILGPDHPDVAIALTNYANASKSMGHYQQTLESSQRASEIIEQNVGSRHPELAAALSIEAEALMYLGKLPEAKTILERSLSILREVPGPANPRLAPALKLLAGIAEEQGHLDEAIGYAQEALNLTEKAFGPDSLSLASHLGSLGHLHWRAGQCKQAQTEADRALSIIEKNIRADHPSQTYSLVVKGRCEMQRKNSNAAVELLERALNLREKFKMAPNAIADTQFALAQALWASGKERDRAISLAQQAQRTFEQMGNGFVISLGETTRWLAAREKPPVRLP